MRVILISGDGIGAGKTTLASRLLDECTFSQADAIREELSEEYPDVDFFDKTQENKSKLVAEAGCTVRQLLIDRGQSKRKEDANYWARKVALDILNDINNDGCDVVTHRVVDDIRYLNEIAVFRALFPADSVIHLHIQHAEAIAEPNYENEELAKIADYTIIRGGKK